MAQIFFGVQCAMKPSNNGITILVEASDDDIEKIIKQV